MRRFGDDSVGAAGLGALATFLAVHVLIIAKQWIIAASIVGPMAGATWAIVWALREDAR